MDDPQNWYFLGLKLIMSVTQRIRKHTIKNPKLFAYISTKYAWFSICNYFRLRQILSVKQHFCTESNGKLKGFV